MTKIKKQSSHLIIILFKTRTEMFTFEKNFKNKESAFFIFNSFSILLSYRKIENLTLYIYCIISMVNKKANKIIKVTLFLQYILLPSSYDDMMCQFY